MALRRYEFEHGKLPDSFDDLAPKLIDDIPWAPFTEEPFKMETVECGVRLYSAGAEALNRADGTTKKTVKAVMFLKTRQPGE